MNITNIIRNAIERRIDISQLDVECAVENALNGINIEEKLADAIEELLEYKLFEHVEELVDEVISEVVEDAIDEIIEELE